MVALSASLMAADDRIAAWFADGKAYGNIRYYYIETDKDNGAGTTSSAHANTIGGQLGYETGELYGLKMGATFMTTNPFALPNVVDTSIIGKDNGARGAADPTKGFSVLGDTAARNMIRRSSIRKRCVSFLQACRGAWRR